VRRRRGEREGGAACARACFFTNLPFSPFLPDDDRRRRDDDPDRDHDRDRGRHRRSRSRSRERSRRH
jgi:hypothetical protein